MNCYMEDFIVRPETKAIPHNSGTIPVIGLYEVKVGKLSEASNKNF